MPQNSSANVNETGCTVTSPRRSLEAKNCERKVGNSCLSPYRRYLSGAVKKLDPSLSTSFHTGAPGTIWGRDHSKDSPIKRPLCIKRWSMNTRRAWRTASELDHDSPTSPLLARESLDCASWGRKETPESGNECNVAEARGRGTYFLHAVLGQGSFGRIHLASWRNSGEAPLVASPIYTGQMSTSNAATHNKAGDARVITVNSRQSTQVSYARVARPCHGRISSNSSDTVTFVEECTVALMAMLGTTRARVRGRQRGLISQQQRVPPLPPPPPPMMGHRVMIPAAFGGGNEGAGYPPTTIESIGDSADQSPWDDDWGGSRLRAVKSVCKRKLTEKGLCRHMETELTVLKQCSHPFIVSLKPGGHFQTSGHLHLVLDYCPGGDLFSLLARQGRLTEPQARICAAQMALALQHLHAKHIAYRDLKPENVCLDSRGRVILVDFSLAKTGLDKAPGGKTFTLCGSAAYVAPEMLAKSGHDTRVDLWSLGCVLFEALVGAHPFRGPRGERCDRQEIFDKIRHGRLQYPPLLSDTALSFLQGLLVANPEKRFRFILPAISVAKPSCTTDQEGGGATLAAPAPAPLADACSMLQKPNAPMDVSSNIASITRESRNDAGCNHDSRGDIVAQICGQTMNTDIPGNATTISERCLGTTPGGRDGTSEAPPKEQRYGDGVALGLSTMPLLLEHAFFSGLPGWGGPGTGGAWEESKMEALSVELPELNDTLDVRHFDPRFTSQKVELALQGHPHKGGPTPSFDNFQWRPDGCIEYAQIEERRKPIGFLGSMASAFGC